MTRLVALLVLALPGVALAAGGEVLDYTGSTIGGLMQQTRGIAYGLLILSLVIALAVETFGGSRPRYPQLLMRFVFIMLVLAYYPEVMTRVVGLSQSIAKQLGVDDGFSAFTRATDARTQRLDAERADAAGLAEEHERAAREAGAIANWNRAAAREHSSNPVVVEGATRAARSLDAKRADAEQLAAMERARESASTQSAMAGFVFDSLIALVVLLGHGVGWLMTLLSQVLAVTLYVMGPLALAFSVPASFGIGGMWFRTWVTILSWPILQGLLFKIALAVGTETMRNPETDASFRAVLVSILTVAIGLLTPLLARSFIGGALGNLASEGLAVAMGGMMLATRDLGRTAADFATGSAKAGAATARGAHAVSSAASNVAGQYAASAGVGSGGLQSTARALQAGVMPPPPPPPGPSAPSPSMGGRPPPPPPSGPAPSAPPPPPPAPAPVSPRNPLVAAPLSAPPVARSAGTQVARPPKEKPTP